MVAVIDFPDIYITVIYDYIKKHDDEIILYKNIRQRYKISYPTIRSRIKWLLNHDYIAKEGRRIRIIPLFWQKKFQG